MPSSESLNYCVPVLVPVPSELPKVRSTKRIGVFRMVQVEKARNQKEFHIMPVSSCPPDQSCRRSETEEVDRNEGRGYAHTDRIVFQHAHGQRGTGTGEGVEVTRHGH